MMTVNGERVRESSAIWELCVQLWRRFVRRYVQFCIVGGSGVVVDMGIIWLLASPSMLGWNLTVSKVVAAEVAIFNNFLWNDLWTFRGLGADHGDWAARVVRLGKFNLICVAGIFLSVALLNLQVYGLGMNVYLANFLSIVAVSFWNFFLNLKFGWNGLQNSRRAKLEATADLDAYPR